MLEFNYINGRKNNEKKSNQIKLKNTKLTFSFKKN